MPLQSLRGDRLLVLLSLSLKTQVTFLPNCFNDPYCDGLECGPGCF